MYKFVRQLKKRCAQNDTIFECTKIIQIGSRRFEDVLQSNIVAPFLAHPLFIGVAFDVTMQCEDVAMPEVFTERQLC